KQLGPTWLIYPGAFHTRLIHSLGVYHLSRKIIISLLTRGANLSLDVEGIDDFLCASLLHDIGHFPYAHSLKELDLIDHEKLATMTILGESDLNKILINENYNPNRISEILDSKRETNDKQALFFRSLLSGALDPDKLDYLNRDALFSGVTYGIQDSSYIISHLTVKNGKSALLAKAELSVEHLLFAKYQMYKTVYWHEITRCATAMIKKALINALDKSIIYPEQLYNNDDYSFEAIADKYPMELNNIIRVRNNDLLVTKYQKSFDDADQFDSYCKPLVLRTKIEKQLYNLLLQKHPTLREDEVIIDIPEPISFESDILLVFNDDSAIPFKDYNELFTKEVRANFIKTLRKTRIFTIDEISCEEIKEAIQNVRY
ncbi:MAG: HD domain-containing protein, partial [Spirochaetaceae bacterium]|nr:HD domain-containing protein [Spirochaetaceae bacterium]